MGASWNSTPLQVLYNILGWIAFVSWSISFYPQVILNFQRKRFQPLHFFIFRAVLVHVNPIDKWAFIFTLIALVGSEFFSVVGLNFDFVLLNLTKHSSYLIYNAALFFSSTVQSQYRQKYGFDQVNVVEYIWGLPSFQTCFQLS